MAARLRRDREFCRALLVEAVNVCLSGDMRTGNALLRDLVNATIGFEGLAAELERSSESLRRMLAANANPSAENFFGIIEALQKQGHVRLRLTADVD